MFVWRFIWWILRALLWPARGRRRTRGSSGGTDGPFPVQVMSVQDGDSLVVRRSGSGDRNGFRVRLYAIDAPESDQEFGREAGEYLRRLVSGRADLILEPVDTDRYGRLVGVLYYREVGRQRSINRLMVQQGLAHWYRQYGGHGLGLEHAEREAQGRRRGLWASGRPVAPWDHRRRQRERSGRWSLVRTLLFATVVSVAVLIALYWLRS